LVQRVSISFTFNNLFSGIWGEDPFFVYKPNIGETVYHQSFHYAMDEQDKAKLPHSIQSDNENNQFYVIVVGNHRKVVWNEL
jgi:hypothetical protein